MEALPPCIKTIGMFLNLGGGCLSFHNPLTQEHLATLPTRFPPAGVLPALGLSQGRLRLRCGLPPPSHVFLGRSSTYRRPGGAGWRRWHIGDVPFHSVRAVIQKFEELAEWDADLGLTSSFSCSTLTSGVEAVGSPRSIQGSEYRERRLNSTEDNKQTNQQRDPLQRCLGNSRHSTGTTTNDPSVCWF